MESNKSAIMLDEELQKINAKFENGEMKAFGVNQAKILKEFQEIRIMQAQLSMKQVAMGSERVIQGDNIKDFTDSTSISELIRDKQEDLTLLTDSLMTIGKSIGQINQTMRTQK
eukprot:TRINITY_DN3844_c0_g1_i1.p1 TRINITY_DN3844_c0_g1~~TRINITY_DN3844_c0_g1_i1.p1  ORF type:complete len:114 (-),score=24.44 TRINITY_DN3844_c0_g1_i1:8-349(-)